MGEVHPLRADRAVPVRGAGNLPVELNGFVGRRREIAQLITEVERGRLVTLTGAGGSGKSRLARRVGAAVAAGFVDGVYWVELAPLTDPGLVEPTLCAVLGVSEGQRCSPRGLIAEELRDRRVLLVLDNCEHLVEHCAELVDFLLGACADVHVLATSREALRVGGEVVFTVPPLSTRVLDGVGGLGSEAAQLFLQRATTASRNFTPGPDNAVAIAELCARLDGMPLAIELAAARVSTLTVPQIVQRLANPLALLTTGTRTAPPRHRTLRATLEWSYQLLAEPERALLGRLSVFSGGWTIEAAEVVGSGAGIAAESVLDLLGELVAKSLVHTARDTRYDMLEPLRQFSHAQLERDGGLDRVRDRHADHFLGLVDQLAPDGADEWRTRLAAERANLRAALARLLEHSPDDGLRMATLLARGLYWGEHAVTEGRIWLQRCLDRTTTPGLTRIEALVELGWMLIHRGDYPDAIEALQSATEMAESHGDTAAVVGSLAVLGDAVLQGGNQRQLDAIAARAADLCDRLPQQRGLVFLLSLLGKIAITLGQLDLAEERARAGLALSRKLEDPFCESIVLVVLGTIALERADHARATDWYLQELRLMRSMRHSHGVAYGLRGLALATAQAGHPRRAARLWGAVTALSDTIGIPLTPFDRAHPDYEGRLTASGVLTEKAALERGRAMTVEAAIDYALATPPPTQTPGELTPREREVLAGLAAGHTNRQIAETLVISVATVERHLATIYRKIGVRGRTEAAVHALTKGLVTSTG